MPLFLKLQGKWCSYLVKMSQFTCHWGNFSNAALPVLSLPLEHSAKASSIPSGTVFLCLLVEGDVEIEFPQSLGQRLMLLFLLGMFWGLGVCSSTLSPHALPAPTTVLLIRPNSSVQSKNTSEFEYPRSRAAWDWNTHRPPLSEFEVAKRNCVSVSVTSQVWSEKLLPCFLLSFPFAWDLWPS